MGFLYDVLVSATGDTIKDACCFGAGYMYAKRDFIKARSKQHRDSTVRLSKSIWRWVVERSLPVELEHEQPVVQPITQPAASEAVRPSLGQTVVDILMERDPTGELLRKESKEFAKAFLPLGGSFRPLVDVRPFIKVPSPLGGAFSLVGVSASPFAQIGAAASPFAQLGALTKSPLGGVVPKFGSVLGLSALGQESYFTSRSR